MGDVPWGAHLCQFYEDRRDLTDILVPYFRTGLRNNEFCMWVTSEPLRSVEAKAALAEEIPNLEEYLHKGQIEILDYSQWYTPGGRFEADRVLKGWVQKLGAALERGFDGLRLTGNTFWLEKSDWQDFKEYEATVDGVMGQYRMLALCTYSLAKCGAPEILDVVANHAFALIKRAGKWELIESGERKRAEAAAREEKSRRAFAEALDAERRRLNGILDLLPVMVCLITPDYHVPFANRSFRETFGDAGGRTCYDYIFQLAEPCQQCESLIPLKTGRPHHWVNLCPGDRVIEAHDFPVTDVDGSPMILEVDIDITDRQRVEAELRATSESLQRLAAIVESSEEAIIGKTLEGVITSWNQGARRMYGYAAGEVLGKSISLLVPPDRIDDLPQILDRIRQGARVEHSETVRVAKDGRRLTVSLTVSPIKDTEGRVVGASSISHDITESKRMEEQLRTSSLYARSLLEASLDPLVTISPEGQITDVNPATELATGVPRERLISSSFSDYFTEPQKAEAGYQKVLAEGLVRDYPLTIRHASGRTTDVLYNANVYRNESGQVQGVFAAARDVTERKRMEAQLRATSLYARSLLEASLDPLVTISPDGKITDVNQATELATGMPRGWLIGSGFSQYFTEPGRAEAGYQRVLAEGTIRDYPLTIRHVSGGTADVLYNASVYRGDTGQVLGVFAAARDVTERKRMEAQMRATSLYARSLIEASLDPLVTISPEGRITDVNQATELVTGVRRDQLVGSTFSDYFTEPEKAEAGYQKVLAEGLVRDYPLTIRDVSGRTTDVLYNAAVYRNEAGQVLGVFAAARDVTARKRAEAEVAEQRTKELERLAELERFQRLTVGRELKMIELKKEIEDLKKRLPEGAGA